MKAKGGSSSGRGQRDLKVKVRTARGRKLSSTRWLERQLNDPYVQRAKREGFRGRAAYKIMELDDKYRFLVPGARVVDLGCAPGGWCQMEIREASPSMMFCWFRRNPACCPTPPTPARA
jgi:23S rRNA (uridine2552-2'-O)-methyltransferase